MSGERRTFPGTLRAERQRFEDVASAREGRILLAIGVANGAEARHLHEIVRTLREAGAVPDYVGGFVLFVSGYACAADHGLPDLGLVLRSEIARATDTVEQASWFAAAGDGSEAFPIGVDIDTGYGSEPAAVVLTCRQMHKQGAAYVQIEDQLGINKSCGHMAGARGTGKQLVSAEEMLELRLAPALAYAAAHDGFHVSARTDARGPSGVDEALERAHRYAEAGADMIMVEAAETDEELKRIAHELADVPAMTIANMVEGSSKTPYKSARELHESGYDIALYPIGAMLAGHAARGAYLESVVTGRTAGAERGEWFDDFATAIGREQFEAINRMFGV